jgi:hypothetical protein
MTVPRRESSPGLIDCREEILVVVQFGLRVRPVEREILRYA